MIFRPGIEVIVLIYLFQFSKTEFLCDKNETLKIQHDRLQTISIKLREDFIKNDSALEEPKVEMDENEKALLTIWNVSIHNQNNCSIIQMNVTGNEIGRGHLTLYMYSKNRSEAQLICRLKFIVSSPFTLVDKIFNVIVFALVIIVSLFMGALLNFKVLIEQIKHPIAVCVGFFTQYLLMPVLAFTITRIFKYPSVQSIGLFIVGCAPGGTNSNQWTVLLNGDIDLSAVMTFISTLSSLFMMPAWLLTLGKYYTKKLNIKIPYLILARNLLLVIVPYTVGITITHFCPKMKTIVQKLVKPLVIFLIIFFTGVGTYVNFHLFKTLLWYHAITAPLLPWCGFLAGSLIAYICRLPRKQIITVGIETGFQNVGIAMLITQTNFVSPEKEMSSVIVLITGIFSSLPLWFVYFIISCVKRHKKKKEKESIETVDGLLKDKNYSNVPEKKTNNLDTKKTVKIEDDINECTTMLSQTFTEK